MTAPGAPDAAAQRGRRRREAACALPVAGAVLLSPPVASLFSAPANLFGAPAAAIYLLVVWALLIVAAGFLARGLAPDRAD